MFEANEILLELLSKKTFTEVEKNRILQYKKVYSNIVNYLMQRFNNLHIEVLGDYEGSLFQLMFAEKLIGWCWQTTESAIVFLNDNDYIERGTLFIDERTPKYYHSWICFNYYDVDYVLDPSLSILCKKEDYYKMFNPNIIGKVSAKLVKDELIRQITSVKEEKKSKEQIKFIKTFIEKANDNDDDEIIVYGKEDVNTPLYRNGAGYRAELENGKIKRLTVHYYYTDC